MSVRHAYSTPSKIADGQEAVFRYRHRGDSWENWEKSKECIGHPRLTCILVCPVVLTTVLLAVTVNLFWKTSFDSGLLRQQTADALILSNFNASSTDTWQMWGCHRDVLFCVQLLACTWRLLRLCRSGQCEHKFLNPVVCQARQSLR